VVFFAFLRQACEQYLTSSQFFSQALRQVIVRWQTAHNLLGKLALLPLKFIVHILSELEQRPCAKTPVNEPLL
jgi:hypothetical protein